ncbi:MAG: porin family protein [Saprospiraceae bacterium]|nr:porin family protein [Saprospiraceae bacterium]
MHHLFGKKIILTVFGLALASTLLFGQSNSVDNYNYKGFQKKAYYFGLNLGMNNSGYRLNQSRFFIGNDEIRVVEPSSGIGLELHMIANLKLGDNFDFRFLPGFSFASRQLEFTSVETGITEINSAEPVYFELPFQVRYKSKPYKDKRVFVTAGLKYGYDVAGNSESKQSILKFSSHDFQWEVGLGMQFFYPFFIFSPEIKFSRGITNNLIYDNQLVPAKVLENVFSEVISISFSFEG